MSFSCHCQDLYRPRDSGHPKRQKEVSPNVWEDALKAVTWIFNRLFSGKVKLRSKSGQHSDLRS